MFVKPAPGVLLRDPVTKQLLSAAPVEGVDKPVTVLPEAGMKVSDFDGFWLRRIRDGDAVLVTNQPAASAASTGSTVSIASKDPGTAAETGAK